ncbi:hypothetical protein BT63DRAFT_10731 [Microthyrium microscopicum]|uniref:D-serine dehydratase-like domain-containing protein n=1 Tax=Microthyrium microscopicum TaxID=703497 RepID=A0A6A6USQ6_9PEZI|nr:hypothetical protein BT63DRAFT_10731 [Microthyrium microscopicum]
MVSHAILENGTNSLRHYVGRYITDLPKPAVIIDRSKMRRHCQSLDKAVNFLGVDFRFHVKTHKTREGVRLQAGESKDVRLIASTMSEIDFLQPVLRGFLDAGRKVNMLYGMPLPPSQVEPLADKAQQLGPGTISVLIDHASQLQHLIRFFEKAGTPAGVYLKVDTGYHRAGLPPSGINKDGLVTRLMDLEKEGKIDFIGLYSHSSLSYNDSTTKQAMANLEGEILGCLETLDKNASLFPRDKNLTISVGASPQVTAVENLVGPENTLSEGANSLRQTMQKAITERPSGFCTRLELHAGVYPLLDVQQLSTHSRADFGDYEEEIAICVLAEVVSVYNDGERAQPEALLAVGVTGLGREPCAAYEGWGILDREAYSPDSAKPERRLVLSRISQEHSIVAWSQIKGLGVEEQLSPIPLEVGQTVRIYPNHACIAGAMFDSYFVVDSSEDGKRIVDIWERASRR